MVSTDPNSHSAMSSSILLIKIIKPKLIVWVLPSLMATFLSVRDTSWKRERVERKRENQECSKVKLEKPKMSRNSAPTAVTAAACQRGTKSSSSYDASWRCNDLKNFDLRRKLQDLAWIRWKKDGWMAAFEILAAQLSKPLSTLASFDVEKFVRPNKDSFQLP